MALRLSISRSMGVGNMRMNPRPWQVGHLRFGWFRLYWPVPLQGQHWTLSMAGILQGSCGLHEVERGGAVGERLNGRHAYPQPEAGPDGRAFGVIHIGLTRTDESFQVVRVGRAWVDVVLRVVRQEVALRVNLDRRGSFRGRG